MSYGITGIPPCISEDGQHSWMRWSEAYRASVEARWYGNVIGSLQANQCTICDLRITRRV